MPLRATRGRGGVRRLKGRARAHVVVTGRVQGVFFRSETRDRAASLGLAGWVRNNPDGSVEAVFEGELDRVESMVGWCGTGPTHAEVENVEVAWEEPQGDSGFTVTGGWA